MGWLSLFKVYKVFANRVTIWYKKCSLFFLYFFNNLLRFQIGKNINNIMNPPIEIKPNISNKYIE